MMSYILVLQNPHNCVLCFMVFCSVYAMAILIANYLAITGLEAFTLHLENNFLKLGDSKMEFIIFGTLKNVGKVF